MSRPSCAIPTTLRATGLWVLLLLPTLSCLSTTAGLPKGDPVSGYGITGFVGQSSTTAAPGVTVALVDVATGETVSAVQSNFVGKYTLYPVSPGRYRLRVGGIDREVTVSDGHVRLDIDLSAAGGHMAYLPHGNAPSTSAPPRSGSDPPLPSPARGAGTDGDLFRLLTSSIWCSFSHNKRAGVTRSGRYRFFPDGTYSSSARGEVYSSGTGGTHASQSDAGADGRWEVRGTSLYLSDGAGPMEPIDLEVKANSNGHPILVAAGREYSQC